MAKNTILYESIFSLKSIVIEIYKDNILMAVIA